MNARSMPTFWAVPESSGGQTDFTSYARLLLSQAEQGGLAMSAILMDVLLFSCLTAFYAGIVIAAASLLLG